MNNKTLGVKITNVLLSSVGHNCNVPMVYRFIKQVGELVAGHNDMNNVVVAPEPGGIAVYLDGQRIVFFYKDDKNQISNVYINRGTLGLLLEPRKTMKEAFEELLTKYEEMATTLIYLKHPTDSTNKLAELKNEVAECKKYL